MRKTYKENRLTSKIDRCKNHNTLCVTELAPGQVLTKMNMTFINRKNTKIKGPLNGCDQIKNILQMTKTNDTLSLPFTTQ